MPLTASLPSQIAGIECPSIKIVAVIGEPSAEAATKYIFVAVKTYEIVVEAA